MRKGSKYNPKLDTLKISNTEIDNSVDSKRGVLSQTAKVFDPLSLCIPVTVRANVLLCELWSLKLDWDEVMLDPLWEHWSSLAGDLAGLSDLKFPRQAINQDSPATVHFL